MRKVFLKLALLLTVLAFVTISFVPVSVSASNEFISIDVQSSKVVTAFPQSAPLKTYGTGIDTVEQTAWGYKYILGNGDIVEVGDSTTSAFKANVKTIRNDGVAWFSLGWTGGTFVPQLENLTVSFNFSSSTNVKIYPVSPSERLPEGGIEYDISLLSRPAQNVITLNIDWQGITWQKILPLDVEYDQNKCVTDFGIQGSPYVLTATSIVGTDGVTYKTRPEYEVNSYLGSAMSDRQNTQIMGWNPNTGQPITYTDLSHTYLYIHRGQMTDALGAHAWVDDININQTAKTISFTLPRAWLRDATYPVSQVCGVDPAYTQLMVTYTNTGGTDGTWIDHDTTYNSAVLSIVMANIQAGTENLCGIRANGSSLARYVNMHEAEGGGETHCRMFVQTDASGIYETYSQDYTDSVWYIVGYWTNTTFTESDTLQLVPSSASTWTDATETVIANRVYHILFANMESDTANTVGIRANGSALQRKILVHEPEAGGNSYLDMFVKADASGVVECYTTDETYARLYKLGYFGSEMDFVETWETNQGIDSWADWDLTAYLDADGRMADFLLVHNAEAATATMGVRAGDDTTTARTLVEHEAESATGSTGEFTGFGISAQSNASGVVKIQLPATTSWAYLTGYFKPGGATYDITNAPTSKAFGVVAVSTTYWSNGSQPASPLADAGAYFTITSTGSAATDIDVHGHNATGGVGWTLTSNAPGSNEYRIKMYKEGDTVPSGGIYLTTSDQEFISNLASGSNIDIEFSLGTASAFTDNPQRTWIITLTGRAVS